MQKKIIVILLLIVPLLVSAQYTGTKRIKKGGFLSPRVRKTKEWVFGFGASNFLGELGGANQIGTNFVKDFEFSMTRPSAQFAFRYRFKKRWAVKTGLYWQMVSGADHLTKEEFRHNRNLSFRSNIFELSSQAEFIFTKEQVGRHYKIKNAKGMKNFNLQSYLFVGFGGFFYNPKAKYDGRWVALQPLSTEGQGLPGGAKKYSRFSFCIPYGIGLKNALTAEWTVGLEIGMRKTFTDYIDDVSTVYYDSNALLAAKGQMAVDLADPSLYDLPGGNVDQVRFGSNKQGGAGQQRGDKRDLDSYMFINITGSYIIPFRTQTRSKF
jgi:hypothetical protein